MLRRNSPIPLDATLLMARDPYRWMMRIFDRLETDVFATRLAGRKTICLRGAEAGQQFYDAAKFFRAGAAPLNLNLTLFGRGGVQGLDGADHLHRKGMFIDLLGIDPIASLRSLYRTELQRRSREWNPGSRVVLYDELTAAIFRSSCEWAGVPVTPQEEPARRAEVVAMYEHADSLGPAALWTIAARRRAQHWLERIVEQIRAGQLSVDPHRPAFVMAHHRDLNGELLPAGVAAVELLNIIRPLVAVSVFATQAALALHNWPLEAERVKSDEPGALNRFAQEVRRYFPFFPAALARVREEFQWRGERFPRRVHVLFDLFGTNHHPDLWTKPEVFDPSRFCTSPGLYQFVPQGGGDPSTGHRCPGDLAATALIEETISWLLHDVSYSIPPQDLELTWDNLPALPRSRLILQFSAAGLPPAES